MDVIRERALGPQLADLCQRAAEVILPLWKSGVEVMTKADESPVTVADQRAEALIVAALAEAFPEVPVIAEEEVAANGPPAAAPVRYFLVDPLDGTKAFVRGDPNFTVNIGLVIDGRAVAGAVAAPASGEIWMTTAEGAAKRRFEETALTPIRARPWPRGQAVALVSHTMKEETAVRLAEQYGFDKREPMDSSIKLCRIAEGSADIYPRHGPTMEWDVAAGQAVLEAAGGRLTTPEGEPFGYGKAAEGFRNGWFVARGA